MNLLESARKGQTTIEFLLLLSVVVLLILAAITTVTDISKVQQNATQAVRSGVENASLSLLQQFAEQRVGLQLTNVSEVDASLVRLEVAKSDPYFANQPAVMQVMVWNDYSGVMLVPQLRATITGPDGNEITSSPGSEFNVTVTLVRSITVTFVPHQIGNYNVTVTAIDADGQKLKEKKVPFAVVGGGVGGADVVVERKIVEPMNTHFVETIQLPNATIRSATLELADTHEYVFRNVSFYAYDWVFKHSVFIEGSATGVTSFHDTNSPLIAVVPDDAIIYDADLDISSATVWISGRTLIAPPATRNETRSLVHTGANVINVQAQSPTGGCGSNSCNQEVLGTALLQVSYYGPDSNTAKPEKVMNALKVNGLVVPLATSMDISPYLQPGMNTLNFTYIDGTFTYKLHVVTG
ncbi:Uncharacterised protein [Candidatus Burarchaeum australiense]|nr:Uncharacterised protein [Candidatus Burarchaeum australiense]